MPTEAYARGISHGWDAANYAEAYGRDAETPEAEAARRSQFEVGDKAKTAYRRGFLVGWRRFDHGLWSDGTPMEVDD